MDERPLEGRPVWRTWRELFRGSGTRASGSFPFLDQGKVEFYTYKFERNEKRIFYKLIELKE